jgi:hypothetical protein
MKIKHPLNLRTKIRFNIGQGLDTGEAIIIGKQKDEDNWVYKIKVTKGDRCEMHLNQDNELWVNDFEIKKIIKSKKHRCRMRKKKK